MTPPKPTTGGANTPPARPSACRGLFVQDPLGEPKVPNVYTQLPPLKECTLPSTESKLPRKQDKGTKAKAPPMLPGMMHDDDASAEESS